MANEIVLTFDFEAPPQADTLAEVFAALARDYRDMSRGRALVVTRVRTGSIIIELTDAVLASAPYVAGAIGAAITTMAAINTVAKFAENLKAWFGRSKTDEGKKRLYKKGRKSPGQRSVEALIDAAAKTKSRVHFKHLKENGETLEAEITPIEAIAIQEALQETAPAQKIEVAGIAIDAPKILSARPEIRRAIERLHQVGGAQLTPPQMEAVVDIIVSSLQSVGGHYALPTIAADLELHGMYDLARAVKRHIRSSGGQTEPPLTKT